MWALAPSMYKFLRGKGEESAPATTPPPEPPVKKDKTCEEQLRDLWKKISQPEYAIGQGILSQDDYNSIKDTYYGQSQISIGLILPVAFLTFAILATPQLGLKSGWTVWPGLALAQGLLLWVGADRKHKFETTVESFISSRFLNTCNAKKDAAKTKAATPAEGSKQRKLVRDELKSLLKGAKIGDSRLEIILPPDDPAANEPTQPPGTPPATPPEQSPAGAQGAEAPSQGPILPMDDPAGSTS
jgi:hypothetical protein